MSRPITRRRALWLAGTGALVPLAAACGAAAAPTPIVKEVIREIVVTATPDPAAKPAVPAAAPKTSAAPLEIKLSTDFNAGVRKEFMELLKKRFEEKSPNARVTLWHMGSGGTTGAGGYTDVVIAQILTGTAADLIHSWGSMVAERGDALADVSA